MERTTRLPPILKHNNVAFLQFHLLKPAYLSAVLLTKSCIKELIKMNTILTALVGASLLVCSEVKAQEKEMTAGTTAKDPKAEMEEVFHMTQVRVRYMVNELDPAVKFYTTYLNFRVERQVPPNFAMLSLGNLELILSTPFGPGGAAKPMLDGRRAEPGGWNRIVITVDDLSREVAQLRKAMLHFRNDIVSGPGGSEILIDDPSGNPIELFQPQ